MKHNFNIIVFEDDRQLREDYKMHFEKNLKVFRDSVTFIHENNEEILWDGLNIDLPLIIILDIIMAEDLDENLPYAPVCSESNSNPQEHMKYVDYELGIKIGERIRKGHFPLIDKNVPLLFISARHNRVIMDKIKKTNNSWLITKPFWFEELDTIIKIILDAQINNKP